jgi:hypothetical protein
MFNVPPRWPLLAFTLAGLVSGCSKGVPGPSESGPAIRVGYQGTVLGGQQPVTGSSIQLYAVGTTGDGSAATPLLSPAPVTDANGNFNITGAYTCPAANPLVYIVATGGNPGLPSNNPQISLMAALGPCASLSASTYIVINELTTVGAVYPLAAFMTSPSAIGSGTTDAPALASSFTLASELVNTATGTAPGTNVPAGTTVPAAQIDTIADILASCINSTGGASGDGSTCGTLFAMTTPATTPPTTPAGNTILALLNLANHPTLNTPGLYGLISSTAPFQPAQAVEPPDLAVRLLSPSGLTASPASVSFGPLTTGFSSAETVTLTNNGSATVLISGISISGANSGDFAWQDACSLIAARSSCSMQVTFTPQATGNRSGWLLINNNSVNPVLEVALSGTGAVPTVAGPIIASPSSLSFTALGVPQTVTLTNYGSTVLTINGISLGSDYYFTETNNCGATLQPQSMHDLRSGAEYRCPDYDRDSRNRR